MNMIQTNPTRTDAHARRSHTLSQPPRGVTALGMVLAALTLEFAPMSAHGQGTVNFANRVPGVISTRVYGPAEPYRYWPTFGNTALDFPSGTQTYAGSLITGSGWRAQLWAAPGADQPESALRPAYPTTTFRTGATLGGTVMPVTVTLTNVPAEVSVATVQMRVWPVQYASWDQALQQTMQGDVYGKSPPFKVEALGGLLPAYLANLQSFSLIAESLDNPVRPLIYAQPRSQVVAAGDNVAFTVGAASPTTLSYEWRFNGTNLAGGVFTYEPTTNSFTFPPPNPATGIVTVARSYDRVLAFAATNVLQLTNVQPSQAGIYSLAVVNRCCPLTNHYPIETLTAVSSNVVLIVGQPGALTVRGDRLPHIVLDWDGAFLLQSAPTVGGPFTDVPGPVVFGPYTNSDSASARFFRLRN